MRPAQGATPAADDGVSLRDVIKGFYNYGVCRDALWPYVAGGEPGQLSIERARDAKNLSLGAYYRLRPNLNTYHAALHETGALLVSAELHDGWRHDRVRAAQRRDRRRPAPASRAAPSALERHAFVILGYTPAGFLVLNSWGRDWGGWTPAPARAPVPGVALWRYDDWADTIMDGWVLRLGVGAAEAFEYLDRRPGPRLRRRGAGALDAGARHPRQLPPPRRRRLRRLRRLRLHPPHARGDPAPARGGRRAAAKPYQGVLLTFAGGLTGLRDATDHVARWKRPVRDAGWYPFTVLWCVDYVEQARAVLEGVFAEAGKRAGGPGPRLDRVVEELAHGIGRALWRDIGRAAERAARPGGPLHDLARAGAGARGEAARLRPPHRRGVRGRLRARGAAARHADRALRRRGRPLLRDAARASTSSRRRSTRRRVRRPRR